MQATSLASQWDPFGCFCLMHCYWWGVVAYHAMQGITITAECSSIQSRFTKKKETKICLPFSHGMLPVMERSPPFAARMEQARRLAKGKVKETLTCRNQLLWLALKSWSIDLEKLFQAPSINAPAFLSCSYMANTSLRKQSCIPQ